MTETQIERTLAELKRSSRTSIVMVLIGAAFLIGSLYYSATKLRPLQADIEKKKKEIAVLEAKKIELQRVNDMVTQRAKPVAADRAMVKGWLYIGRIGKDGKWAPASEGVAPTPDPLQTSDFKRVTIKKSASIVGRIEPKTDIAAFTPLEKGPALFVKAGTQLNVTEIRRETSIGDGWTIWAKVEAPSHYVLAVD
jgi:hypothetical protein